MGWKRPEGGLEVLIPIYWRFYPGEDPKFPGLDNLKLNGQVINMNICSVGTLTNSLVSARDVFKTAILSNAGAFIAVHNHPTGGLEPSQEDKDITKVLLEASKIMDIHMLDHIIVAAETGEMYSFKEDGLLDQLRARSRSWER